MTKTPESTAPYLLGLETSGQTCAVGISQGDQLLLEISAHIRHIHSTHLAPFVQQAMETAGIALEQLSAIVVSAGPGSFTGLRIGYSLAKGMAHAGDLPLVEVPTLDVWAFQIGTQPQPIYPLIDAHRGEVFTARYRHQSQFERETDYQLLTLDDFCEFLRQQPGILTGRDVPKLADRLLPGLSALPVRVVNTPPHPTLWALLTLGYRKFQSGEFAALETAEPMYMRAFKGIL
ncbi:MAG: tRNA (adenosine(37)-N6)-threonylcarbamoyltransferase complex dimerization subunit type 1 TsaB [Calditrichaeota bacterium]|nr:tRNA (adenosine(37)-N6)-threonylcarbamoyltransferase complex dimerization subunit type 1 TsaB [Calditrichota bacterium]